MTWPKMEILASSMKESSLVKGVGPHSLLLLGFEVRVGDVGLAWWLSEDLSIEVGDGGETKILISPAPISASFSVSVSLVWSSLAEGSSIGGGWLLAFRL